ncbi:MAG: hypothetical protein COA78_37530 [Blastopirellula sp.]|nr:MAG: hypothetical protein COA78_37530 [Blastopirellula sp.]
MAEPAFLAAQTPPFLKQNLHNQQAQGHDLAVRLRVTWQINPNDSLTRHARSVVQNAVSELELATIRYKKSIALSPNSPNVNLALATNFIYQGKAEERPNYSLANEREDKQAKFSDPKVLERWLDALRKASLPEK